MIRVLNMRDPEAKRILAEGTAEYIGRGPSKCDILNTRPGDKGWLGNPAIVGKLCLLCGDVHKTNGSTLPCFRQALMKKYYDDESFRHHFDKTMCRVEALVCWCKPKPCHGDVIAEFVGFLKITE